MSSEGSLVSTPGSALDILIKDRDEWKARALTAEAEVKRLTEESRARLENLRKMSYELCDQHNEDNAWEQRVWAELTGLRAEVKRLREENADYEQALRHMRDSEDICVDYINRGRDAEARAERAEAVVDLARRVAKHSRWADPDPSDLSMLRIELEAYDAARSDETKF